MIDVDKIKVGDKVRLITDNWDDCQEFAEKGNVYTVVPKDNLAEEFFTKDTVEVNIFSYFDHRCEDFELVEDSISKQKEFPETIIITSPAYEYMGLMKGSKHKIHAIIDGIAHFTNNGKLWELSDSYWEWDVAIDFENNNGLTELKPLDECRSSYCECEENACGSGRVDKRKEEARRVVDSGNTFESPTSPLDKQVSGSHYKSCSIQPIEYIHANGLDYMQGNVVKYVTRHKDKNGKADIEKAIHYLELILELQYKDK